MMGEKDAEIHVYVSPEGLPGFSKGIEKFPMGTLVLKEKFTGTNAPTPELYTGMLKRESGYNPKAGDWEFFTLTGDRSSVTSRGKIDACMDCHQQYARTDFITKRYRTFIRVGSSKAQPAPVSSPR
jgi:hypothetical protein